MINDNSFESLIREFGMRNFQLESELINLENKGYEIGHSSSLSQVDKLVDLEDFEFEIVKDAQKMAAFYMIYYCMENSIRNFVSQRLEEIHGEDWWINQVSGTIRAEIEKRKKDEQESGMTARSDDPLAYTFFGELSDIINQNWIDFADTLKSQKAVSRVLSSFNKIRNVIAHSCILQEDEILRLRLLVRDWIRIQG
jgi:hypothetical protein